MTAYPEKDVAIIGIGQSEVARPSAKSALALTLDACRQAIADAGLGRDDIDGLVSYPGIPDDGSGFSAVNAVDIRMALGLKTGWYAAPGMDSPSQLSALFEAISALASGLARHVLVFRTTAEATARAANREALNWTGGQSRARGMWTWTAPFGVPSPAPWYALIAQRWMSQHGIDEEALGWVAVQGRRMAALNPNAIYKTPITLDDYMASRYIATPLRLLDCDVPVDGATAFVLSRIADRPDRSRPVIRFEAIGSAMARGGLRMPEDWSSFGAEIPAAAMWARTDLRPADLSMGQIYDGFSILALTWLEALGICGRGEAGAFMCGATNTGLDGPFPMNTWGGHLSGGRLHGFGHVYEACVQLRGEAGARQIHKEATSAVFCAGAYGLGCGILVRD
jgi:acetyl-CoA acetyltransferase